MKSTLKKSIAALVVCVIYGGVTPAPAQEGDEGFVSKDQTGNDPRDFTSKFMPYYRRTELENNMEVNELTLFGFYAFNGRFGMTYEIPIAREIDYNDVNAFKKATAGGCPPPPDSGNLPENGPLPGGGGDVPFDSLSCNGEEVGVGDTGLRFFTRPLSLEFSYGKDNKNFSVMPTIELSVPTATEDVLGEEALIVGPGITFAFDFPSNKPPFSLGFIAAMNFYDFDMFKDDDREDTSRYRGRWFWMLPISPPTPEWSILDSSGLYIMTEFQPVYDFEEEHFSFWFGPEFGKIFAPGRIAYIKPGIGVDPDEDEGDRDWTLEIGMRYFLD